MRGWQKTPVEVKIVFIHFMGFIFTLQLSPAPAFIVPQRPLPLYPQSLYLLDCILRLPASKAISHLQGKWDTQKYATVSHCAGLCLIPKTSPRPVIPFSEFPNSHCQPPVRKCYVCRDIDQLTAHLAHTLTKTLANPYRKSWSAVLGLGLAG